MKSFKFLAMSAVIGSSVVLAACGGGQGSDAGDSGEQLKGNVAIDGSSTVYPIMEAVGEEYMATQPGVQVSVGLSGTGGGFEKFTKGETDLSNASRPIKDEEKKAAEEGGVDVQEFELAYDGLSVVINKENDWVDHLTVEELEKMWVNDGKAKKWSDIREGWPDEEIKFYSPGHDSGTFDYFDEVILDGKEITESATLSEDDNVLVNGVTGDKNAIGYFGYAYYSENKDKLKVVPIDGGNGPVEPTKETVMSGEYAPLSRPLFTYASVGALKDKEQVYDYVKFTLENAGELAEEVGYVSLKDEEYDEQLKTLEGLKK
ncbi:PstS family phosphate ABC transporter substrate-binding protein [Priestia flexa]|uniref:Phosphate-binding protein n=1 Tax=Priestia flexa TaxID=86664 RepID=A0ABU4JA31_9BACI|nr:PstS family phosphate ABC transporter substrate-binding protein [Priestia flexa]AQX53737.1 phosphate-binding protein [Priestia flexa]MBY6085134.1 PstS family phosphate ABC transporter substrate-binding protein [Priestia flexa]MCA1200656.1 PstS family phosphate ABC transporter substrate-binding protein [Priestia flexa]MCG7311861.1 PstS family phosphate ABC transporter substrate-binding protein [Priestia flexa]MCM3066682.1 PstS family phosphate ABC transporter substrate-binding protein [Pries